LAKNDQRRAGGPGEGRRSICGAGEGAEMEGEGQRAENAFNNINIGGGDGDDGQRVSHRVPR